MTAVPLYWRQPCKVCTYDTEHTVADTRRKQVMCQKCKTVSHGEPPTPETAPVVAPTVVAPVAQEPRRWGTAQLTDRQMDQRVANWHAGQAADGVSLREYCELEVAEWQAFLDGGCDVVAVTAIRPRVAGECAECARWSARVKLLEARLADIAETAQGKRNAK